jgi:sugar O-acyltransferase (sialic acid O-acetyltransferase NeuD family)
MTGNKAKLVIIGDGETAQLVYDYFTSDSNYDVVGFSAERAFLKKQVLFGLPVVPFEEVEKFFDPQTHKAFIAISYTQLNRLRSRLLEAAKKKGYATCSYINPKSFIGNDISIGENCFIFEHVNVQRGTKIGNNVIVWSGSTVGHRTIVEDNCFVASHVALSGFSEVGQNCFLGVNSCTVDGVKIAKDCVIGAGAVVLKDTSEGQVYVGNPAKPLPNKNTDCFITGKEMI